LVYRFFFLYLMENFYVSLQLQALKVFISNIFVMILLIDFFLFIWHTICFAYFLRTCYLIIISELLNNFIIYFSSVVYNLCWHFISDFSAKLWTKNAEWLCYLYVVSYKQSKEVVSHKYYGGEARQPVATTVCKFDRCMFLLSLRSNRAPDINNSRLTVLILAHQDLPYIIFTFVIKIVLFPYVQILNN